MNNKFKQIIRLALGLVSSLLFATGFARAANRIEPLTGKSQVHAATTAPDSGGPCVIIDPTKN